MAILRITMKILLVIIIEKFIKETLVWSKFNIIKIMTITTILAA